MSTMRLHTKEHWSKTWMLVFGAACAAAVLTSLGVARSYVAHHAVTFDEPRRVSNCRDETRKAIRVSEIDLKTLGGIHGLCYAEVNEEDTLLELEIRRSAFLNQQVETSIILWMVVAITLSGVVLACVQLVAGYRLALRGKGSIDAAAGNVVIGPTKVSMSSSVAGVLILGISLAFFYIFVTQVYLIKELKYSSPISVAGTPDLTWGWQTQTANAPRPVFPNNLMAGGAGKAPERKIASAEQRSVAGEFRPKQGNP